MPSLMDVSQAGEEMVILLQHLGHLGVRDGVWLHPGSCKEREKPSKFWNDNFLWFHAEKRSIYKWSHHTNIVVDRHRSDADPGSTAILMPAQIRIRILPQVSQVWKIPVIFLFYFIRSNATLQLFYLSRLSRKCRPNDDDPIGSRSTT